jgi:glycosyltransferase involved in cell wall biosynthesis
MTGADDRGPLRILLITAEYPPHAWTGVGFSTPGIARALARQGHDVHVLALLEQTSRHDETTDGVTVHWRRLLFRGPSRRLKRTPVVGLAVRGVLHMFRGREYPNDSLVHRLNHALTARRELRRLGLAFDVVECPESDGHALLLGRDCPVVVTLRGPAMLHTKLWERLRLRGRIAMAIDRRNTSRGALVIAPTNALVPIMRGCGWLDGRPTEIVPHPFDAGEWSCAVSAADTTPMVLAVGRNEPAKAFDVLVDAVAELHAEGTAVECRCVGPLDLTGSRARFSHDVLEKNRALGSPCHFVGRLDPEGLMELYAQARVVAVPSRLDNIPNVAIEAMASARPVVCTESTGIAPFVASSGAGTVVPSDDAAALAAALRKYIDHPELAEAAGRAGRAAVERDLDADRLANLRVAAYRRNGVAPGALAGRSVEPATRPLLDASESA